MARRGIRTYQSRNPVAKALAVKKLVDTAAKYKTILYLTTPGEVITTEAQALASYLTLVIFAAEITRGPAMEHYEALRVGLDVFATVSEDGFRWDPAYMTRVDDALDAASLTVPKLTLHSVQQAQEKLEAIRNECK